MCYRSFKQPWCLQNRHFYGVPEWFRDDPCWQVKHSNGDLEVGECDKGFETLSSTFKDPAVWLCDDCRAEEGQLADDEAEDDVKEEEDEGAEPLVFQMEDIDGKGDKKAK